MSAETEKTENEELLAGYLMELSPDADARFVRLSVRFPLAPGAAPPQAHRLEGPPVFGAFVCFCTDLMASEGLLSPGEYRAIRARLVGLPEAKAREAVGAALAARRAAQAPLDPAAVAAIEERLAGVDLAPDLAAARAQGCEGSLAVVLVDQEVFGIIRSLFAAPLAPAPAQHGILVIVLEGPSLEPFARDVDLPLPEPGAGVAVVFDIDGHCGALRVVVPAEEPAPPQGGAVS